MQWLFYNSGYMRTYVIIPSGGRGTRTGFRIPKQYIKAGGKEIIVHTLLAFQKNKSVDDIIIAAEPEYFNLISRLAKKYKLNKITGCVQGGNERQDSVFAALKSLNAKDHDLIIVHDAARPLLPGKVLIDAIDTAKLKGNAVVCIKARDTLLALKDNSYAYPPRENTFYIQTPQIFPYGILMKAMSAAYEKGVSGTDESVIVTAIGEKLHLVQGSTFNFKITHPEDIVFLKKLLS
jgi:2-C-methyl-D-erythritol 4-phosphate cytidylyltransferase